MQVILPHISKFFTSLHHIFCHSIPRSTVKHCINQTDNCDFLEKKNKVDLRKHNLVFSFDIFVAILFILFYKLYTKPLHWFLLTQHTSAVFLQIAVIFAWDDGAK